LELQGLLHGQVSGRRPAQDLVDIRRGALVQIKVPRTVGHETTGLDPRRRQAYCRQTALGREGGEACVVEPEHLARVHQDGVHPFAGHHHEQALQLGRAAHS